MSGSPNVRAPSGPSLVATALMVAAAIALAYRFERAERRWWAASHPFAEQKAGMRRMRATFERKRATLTEALEVTGELLAAFPPPAERAG